VVGLAIYFWYGRHHAERLREAGSSDAAIAAD